VILAFVPVTIVASAVEFHRWCGKLVVLVEAHGLAQVGGPTIVYVVVVSPRRHLVADCPCKANTQGCAYVVEPFALLVGVLCEVRLEGLAEGGVALLGSGRHVFCAVIVCDIGEFNFFLNSSLIMWFEKA